MQALHGLVLLWCLSLVDATAALLVVPMATSAAVGAALVAHASAIVVGAHVHDCHGPCCALSLLTAMILLTRCYH